MNLGMLLPAEPRHAGRLARRLDGQPLPALDLADLAAVPPWAVDPDAQEVPVQAALALLAPWLRQQVSGTILRALAAAVGPEAVDAALARPGGASVGDLGLPWTAEPAVLADALAACGRAVLATRLPPPLRCRLGLARPPADPAACAAAAAGLAP